MVTVTGWEVDLRYRPLFLNSHPFLLPSISGKDEIAIAIASPVFLRARHGSAGSSQYRLVLPMPEWIEIQYPQSINSNQRTSNNLTKVYKSDVSWFLYVPNRLCSFFFLDESESKINQDERCIEDKQEHRTVSLSYILRVHKYLKFIAAGRVKSQRKTWKS